MGFHLKIQFFEGFTKKKQYMKGLDEIGGLNSFQIGVFEEGLMAQCILCIKTQKTGITHIDHIDEDVCNSNGS